MKKITRASWPAAVLLALLCVLTTVPPAAAQVQPGPKATAQDEFVPVKDLPAQEQLPAAPLVTAAYAFVWVVLLLYVWSVWRRLGRVEREVGELAARLGQKERRA